MEVARTCKYCGVDDSEMWWKCCPKHTPERSEDVVCAECAINNHRLCLAPGCNRVGTEIVQLPLGLYVKGEYMGSRGIIEVTFCEEH